MRIKLLSLACTVGALIALAQNASGQDAALTQTPATDRAPGANASLQEVVVTAQKVAQNIIEVPEVVTALSAQQLQQYNVVDIQGLGAYAPGFIAVGGPAYGRFQRGATDFVIRGMLPGRTVDPLRQNVTVFMDGVPISGGNIAGLSDIARVEIIEGPQSAYFGRSTFAGAINLITRQPAFKYGATVDAKMYSYGSTDDTLDLEGPIVPDVVALRITGRYYHTDGQYQNPDGGPLGEQQTASVSADMLIKASDRLSISLYGTYWTDNDGPAIDGQIGGPWATVKPNGYNCDMGLEPAGQLNGICGPMPGLNYVSFNKDITALAQRPLYDVLVRHQGVASILSPGFLTHYGLRRYAQEAHGNLEYDLPRGYVLSANLGISREELAEINDGIQQPEPASFLYNGYFAENNQDINSNYDSELRITSPQSRAFTWLLGVNYAYETTRTADVAWYEGPYNAAPPEKETARTLGYFGSVAYKFPHGIQLTAEGRYQQDTVANRLILLPPFGGAQETFNAFTPRVILSKKLTDSSNAYISYAVGNKPGTFNLNLLSLTPAQATTVATETGAKLAVPEEKIQMYELGLKGDFLNDRIRVLADVYYGKWTSQQITKNATVQVLLPSGGYGINSIPVTAAVGLTNIDGFELTTTFRVTENLLLDALFDIANTDIRDYACANCATYETGTPIVTGHQLGLVPKYKSTEGITYYLPPWRDFQEYVRAEYKYRSRIYVDETNLNWIGDSNIWNLRVGIQNDKYRIEVYGTNILNNTQYQAAAWGGSFLAPSLASINEWDVTPADKRTIGLEFRAKF